MSPCGGTEAIESWNVTDDPTARDAKFRLLKPATSPFYGEKRRSRGGCGT
jgi:hypothetical protein